jgi:hypothetical protein
MKNIFTEHPKKVGETYFQHLLKALSFSFKLLLMSFQALIHAFIPCLYVISVSEKIKRMSQVLESRKERS